MSTGLVATRLAVPDREWNGPVWQALVAAPEGWVVAVGYDRGGRSYFLGVAEAGAGEPRVSVGWDRVAEIPTVDELVAVAACCTFAPFGAAGCVRWDAEPSLVGVLRGLAAV